MDEAEETGFASTEAVAAYTDSAEVDSVSVFAAATTVRPLGLRIDDSALSLRIISGGSFCLCVNNKTIPHLLLDGQRRVEE